LTVYFLLLDPLHGTPYPINFVATYLQLVLQLS